MYGLILHWKSFNVNLEKVTQFLKSVDSSYRGINCGKNLEVIFNTDTLTEDQTKQILDYWNNLTEDSIEATSYQTKEQLVKIREQTKMDLQNSALSKLKALGLTDEEISALIK